MDSKNKSLIFWGIYSFVFIRAIDSILYFIINILFFVGIQSKLASDLLVYLIPIISLILYTITTIIVLRKLNIKALRREVYPNNFNITLFILLVVIGITLNPLVNKLSGYYIENQYETVISENYLTIGQWLHLNGWMDFVIEVSRWIIIIILGVLYWKKNKKTNHNNV